MVQWHKNNFLLINIRYLVHWNSASKNKNHSLLVFQGFTARSADSGPPRLVQITKSVRTNIRVRESLAISWVVTSNSWVFLCWRYDNFFFVERQESQKTKISTYHQGFERRHRIGTNRFKWTIFKYWLGFLGRRFGHLDQGCLNQYRYYSHIEIIAVWKTKPNGRFGNFLPIYGHLWTLLRL